MKKLFILLSIIIFVITSYCIYVEYRFISSVKNLALIEKVNLNLNIEENKTYQDYFDSISNSKKRLNDAIINIEVSKTNFNKKTKHNFIIYLKSLKNLNIGLSAVFESKLKIKRKTLLLEGSIPISHSSSLYIQELTRRQGIFGELSASIERDKIIGEKFNKYIEDLIESRDAISTCLDDDYILELKTLDFVKKFIN